MVGILAVTRRLLRSQLAHPQTIIIFLLIPLFFTFMVGGLAGADGKNTALPMALTIPQQPGPAAALKEILSKDPNLSIQTCPESTARQLVHDRKVIAAIVVPANFNEEVRGGKALTYTLIREDQNNLYVSAKQDIDRAFWLVHAAALTTAQIVPDPHSSQWQQTFLGTLKQLQKGRVTLKVQPIGRNAQSLAAKNQTNIGFTVMFVMMSLITTIGVILQERTNGTWQRLMATPLSRGQILAGYLLGYFVLGCLQFAMLIAASNILFGIYWGNLLGVIVLASIYILCSISLALALAGFVRTYQQQQAIASVLLTATSMLAGVFWPLDLEPKFMQTLARGIPQFWAMEGFKNIILRGLDWNTLALPLAVLAGFSIIFFTFGVWRMRWS